MTAVGSRYALVVAGSHYEDPKLRQLRSPAVDAERLAVVLGDPTIGGFLVEAAIDEREGALRRQIAAFLASRRSDDLLLMHFSCHGVQDEAGELHLAACDTETELLGATSIAASWLSEQIARCRSKRAVLLLDCCFSGSFPFGMRARAGEGVAVTPRLGGRGRVVITASSAMEYSWEGDHLSGSASPSIFTQAVLEGLETGAADRDGDHWVSVDELYDFVCDRVREHTPYQRPQKKSDVDGVILLARAPTAPRPPAAPPSRSTSTRRPPAPPPLTAPEVPRTPAPERHGPAPAVVSAQAIGLVQRKPSAPTASAHPVVSAPIAANRVPAHVPPRLRDHLVATLLDLTIVAVLGVVAALIPVLPLIPLSDAVSSAVYYATILPMGAAAYVGLLGRRGRTRTLGQWLCSLRVVAAHGGWTTTRRRMLREALKWFPPLGVAWLVRQGWRRAHGERWERPFHDVLARTELIRERR